MAMGGNGHEVKNGVTVSATQTFLREISSSHRDRPSMSSCGSAHTHTTHGHHIPLAPEEQRAACNGEQGVRE